MSFDLKRAASLIATVANGESVDAVRNAIRFYVAHWYANSDGTDATAKPDSPAMKVCDAAAMLPGAVEEIERLRGLLRMASSKLKPTLPQIAKHLRDGADL